MKKIVSTLLILSIVFTGCSASEEMDKGTLDSWDEVFAEFDESDSNAKKLTALCIITDVALGQMGAYDRNPLLYEFKIAVSTPFSNHSYRKNTYDGRVTSTRAYEINPVVGLGVKTLMGEEKYRELRDKIWNKYNLLIPYNPEQGFVGKYQTIDLQNRLMDKGSYNLNEASIQLPAGFEAYVSREKEVFCNRNYRDK